MQRIIIFDSPDGTGKTEISKALAREWKIPYFKMNTEHENWRKGAFKTALEFDQPYLFQFLKQTEYSVVIDRAWPAEWVYSRVFDRPTNEMLLEQLDEEYAKLGAIIVIPLRRDYNGSRPDEVVEQKDLLRIHNTYLAFREWTTCQTLSIFVDDFNNDLKSQLPSLNSAANYMLFNREVRHITLGTGL